MIKKLFYRAIVFSIGLFYFGVGVAAAIDDGFDRARKIEGNHFLIYYAPELDLSGLIQKLNISPSDKFLAGKSSGEGFSLEGEFAGTLDTLFSRVCNILDMQLYSFKGNIKICRDSVQLNYIYHHIFNNDPANITRSFYAYDVNTVYTSPENFTLEIIGHEIAHAVISHYFVVLPSVKIQEVLSAYVEYQLRKAGQ